MHPPGMDEKSSRAPLYRLKAELLDAGRAMARAKGKLFLQAPPIGKGVARVSQGAADDQYEVLPDSNPSEKTKVGVPSTVPQPPPIQRCSGPRAEIE